MKTTYTIDTTSIGQTLPVTNGFVTDIKMMTPPVYEVPSFDEGRQCWVSACFVLRGSHDIHDLVCVAPACNGWEFGRGGTPPRRHAGQRQSRLFR